MGPTQALADLVQALFDEDPETVVDRCEALAQWLDFVREHSGIGPYGLDGTSDANMSAEEAEGGEDSGRPDDEEPS